MAWLEYLLDCAQHLFFHLIVRPVAAIVCGIVGIPSALKLVHYWFMEIFETWPNFPPEPPKETTNV